MIHSVLKNGLKVIRFLWGLPCILSLLLSFPALSGGSTPDGVRITHPRDGFYINRYNFDAYLISGTADAGKAVAIFANGILMETAPADTEGRFSVKIDFSNQIEYQEFLARSHPFAVLSAPIEIRDSIPRDDAGIVNFARVPDETGFAVLIRSAHGIDTHAPDAVRFTIDDGLHLPYVRDLRSDTVRTVKLAEDPDEQGTFLWAVYDRSLETYIPMTYPLNAVIYIKVEVRDIQNNILQPAPFEFKIETRARKAASRQNLPKTDEFYMIDPDSGDPYDAGIEIIDGELSGAKVVYSSREPLTPAFGSLDGIEEINLAGIQAAGLPVNLIPHTVFDAPVKLFIPVAEDVDITSAGLAYHDGTQWLPAADADGNVLSDGEGWMVPGSRINHAETRPALIEVQVYHFSGTQAFVFAAFDGTSDEGENNRTDGTHVFINANCFINSAAGGAEFGSAALIGLIGFVGFLIRLRLIPCSLLRGASFNRRKKNEFNKALFLRLVILTEVFSVLRMRLL